MTATNHVLSGGLIGFAIGEPLLALSLAFVSHFLLDMLPHYGFMDWDQRQKHKKLFNISTALDAGLAVVIFIVFAFIAPWFIAASALAAFAPDLSWVYRFVFRERLGRRQPSPHNFLEKFHKNIQRYEFPLGLAIEVPFALVMISIINHYYL